MVETQHYDRGTLYDNLSQEGFIEEVSPDEAFLNPGREFYDSDMEYFTSLLSAEFDGPRPIKPDPLGDEVQLYEAPGVVVAIGEKIELYELRPTVHQLGEVFDKMISSYGGGSVRNVEEISFDEGVEKAVERIFEEV
jgi:hypothetical protein